MAITCKFVVGYVGQNVDDNGEKVAEIITLNAASPGAYDPAAVVPENSYAVGSPGAEMMLTISNREKWGKMPVGKIVSFEITE